MTGGLRATHRAGGYTHIDPSSPLFILGDCVYIPAVFASFHGDAIDEKTPLLRACALPDAHCLCAELQLAAASYVRRQDAVNREAVRMLKLLGFEATEIFAQSGLEQEFFLVPRNEFAVMSKRATFEGC